MKHSCLVMISLLLVAASHGRATSRDAFDWAFAFASAISTNDLADQARAQHKVIRDLLAAGNPDKARQLAPAIPNWRRGVAWAEIGGALAAAGRADEARQAFEQAHLVRVSYRGGWEADRIGAHIAMAHAAQGETAPDKFIGDSLPAEGLFKLHTARANQMVQAGRFSQAQQLLAPLAASTDFDLLTILLEGYLQMLQNPGLTNALERQWILSGTRDTLEKLPFLRRMEVMDRVGAALGVEYLSAYEATLRSEVGATLYQAPALARLGRTWLELGQTERGRALLQMARQRALSGDPMEQPAACAEVAAVLAATGERAAALELTEAGLQVAAGFVNARPRALAIADLCRSLGRQGAALTPQWQTRLAQLLDGLQAPW